MVELALGAAAVIFMVIAVARRPHPDKPTRPADDLCPYCDHNPHDGGCRELVDAGGWGRDTVCGCTWVNEKPPPASR